LSGHIWCAVSKEKPVTGSFLSLSSVTTKFEKDFERHLAWNDPDLKDPLFSF